MVICFCRCAIFSFSCVTATTWSELFGSCGSCTPAIRATFTGVGPFVSPSDCGGNFVTSTLCGLLLWPFSLQQISYEHDEREDLARGMAYKNAYYRTPRGMCLEIVTCTSILKLLMAKLPCDMYLNNYFCSLCFAARCWANFICALLSASDCFVFANARL